MSNEAIVNLVNVGIHVTCAIEDGTTDLTFDEVYASLDDLTIFEKLRDLFPGRFRFGENESTLLEDLQQASTYFRSREQHKYGIKASGLCLLQVFVFEAIQTVGLV